MLGRQQHELYGPDSFLGRWLESKNAIEQIDGHLFVHGGLHPDLAGLDDTLDTLNRTLRAHYRHDWYPRPDTGPDARRERLLLSTKTGPAWYRGYFKDDLTDEEVQAPLDHFDARAVVVGHTIHRKVHARYDGKVFAIDVKHPDDYNRSFPVKRSEGLLIEDGRYYRVLEDGGRAEL